VSENSPIEWTDHTFNPWWGCAKVSPACDFCYAERDAKRYQPTVNYWGVDAPRREFLDQHWNAPLRWNRVARERQQPARVFCASMADVFDKNAPDGARPRLWELIRQTPYLRWLLLTKRIGNAPSMLPPDWDRGYANVWVGISVVTQKEADRDIPKLEDIPAARRFLSCEPLLEHIDLKFMRRAYGFPKHITSTGKCVGLPLGLDWVIAGGESGPDARPMHPAWARSLRDQCEQAGVPFLFKQWGEWVPPDQVPESSWSKHHDYVEGEYMMRPGKKKAGRMLDGRTWDGVPCTCTKGDQIGGWDHAIGCARRSDPPKHQRP
jgi:protein gp37